MTSYSLWMLQGWGVETIRKDSPVIVIFELRLKKGTEANVLE